MTETSTSIDIKLRQLADKYAETLKQRMDKRVEEMEADDNSHYLIQQNTSDLANGHIFGECHYDACVQCPDKLCTVETFGILYHR